jgi:hypothetical protein
MFIENLALVLEAREMTSQGRPRIVETNLILDIEIRTPMTDLSDTF